MSKLKKSFNQPITMTRKGIFVIGALMALLFLLFIASMFIIVSMSSNSNVRYQTIATEFNKLEDKVASSNTVLENIDALEKRLNQIEVENKKITVDYDNLNMRSARNEQDIFLMQSIVNDKNLDNKLELLETGVKNNTTEIDSIKEVQKSQQSVLDDVKNSFINFKNSIVNKITSMLTTKNSSNSPSKKNSNVVKPNLTFQLASIEYRSGELWAVFVPKYFKSMNDLKFVSNGDVIDNWKVVDIDNHSVKLRNGNNVSTLTVQ